MNDNHDRNRADVVFGEKAALATSVLNFTLDGIPLLYNGEEVGDTTRPSTTVPCGDPLGHLEAGEPAPHQHRRTTNAKLRVYKQIIQMRKDEAALTSGDLSWVNNSNPDGVVSFRPQEGQ